MSKDDWDGESHDDKAVAYHFQCVHVVSMCRGLLEKGFDSFGCVFGLIAQVNNVFTVLLKLCRG